MNTINTQSGERLSFFKLISQKKYRIVIPIIQRDYAQGRKSSKEVRETFLDALYKYLSEGKENRDLDFVYGSITEVNSTVDFIPLDGQQRLTTLFLLHWYLYLISDNTEIKREFMTAMLRDGKSMFTYETRSSSSEFCDALLNNGINVNELLEPDKDAKNLSLENEFSKTVRNCAWFYLSWQYDPTIQSMLTMLDAIHKKFKEEKTFFERLLDDEKPVITFLFLNLKDFKLTDDLYIKMNSRGKPLTPFENFKAKYEQFLDSIRLEKKYYLDFKPESEASIKEYFSYNIDTKWANLFWKYRELQKDPDGLSDTFDEEIMNFIRVIFTSQYAIEADFSQKEKDPSFEYLIGTSVARKDNLDYSDVLSYHKYKDLKIIVDSDDDDEIRKVSADETDKIEQHSRQKKLSSNCAKSLIDSFNCLSNGNNKIKNHLSNNYSYYFNESKTFENAIKHEFESNHERLCFHAYIRYLITNTGDTSNIDSWMRVIHNITHPENTVIDSAYDVAASIKSIEALLPYSNNILEHLKSDPEINFFSEVQVLEEKIKAHLVTKNLDWKESIEAIEKHGYFNGQIGFILEFAGIIQYYQDHINCDWSEIDDTSFHSLFTDYAQKAGLIFDQNYENRKNNEDNVFERAVLTKGDYLTTASQYRKNLLSASVVKNNIKRDHSWKRLLRYSNDDWSVRRQLVKAVFDDDRLDVDNLKTSLESICQDKTETWRDLFIDCPELFDYSKQGFIRYEADNSILLYGASQSNFYHVELYTYYFWLKYIKPHLPSFVPFKEVDIKYNQVKSIDESADITFNNFCYNRIHYNIRIAHDYDGLTILFSKAKGENKPELYSDEIVQFLQRNSFTWSEEEEGYLSQTPTLLGSYRKLNSLVKYLNSLVEG